VIIRYLNPIRPIVGPDKTDSELIVDPYAMLACPAPFLRFEPVTGRNPERIQGNYRVELIQFSPRHTPDIFRTDTPSLFRVFSIKNILGTFVVERFDHAVKPPQVEVIMLNL